MFRAVRLLQAVVFLIHCVGFVTATCYAPDGGEVTVNDLAPCSNDPTDPLSHVCCNLNRPKAPGTSTNASEVRDTCLPNGLCQNLSLLSDGSSYLQWGRNFCTNRDWSTGQCLDVCTRTAQDRAGSKRVIPCSGKNSSITWCCGDSDDCCTSTDQEDLISLSPTFTIDIVSSTTSSSLSTPATVQTTSTVTSTSTENTPTSTSSANLPSNTSNPPAATVGNTELSRGAKAGIAISAVAGAVLLVAVGVWIAKALAWRKIAHAAKGQNSESNYNTGSDVEGLYGQHPQKYAHYVEVDATTPPVEVLSTPDPVEAPDTQVDFRSSRFGGLFGVRK